MNSNYLLVKKILEQPHGYDWSLQGFGMLRLYLSKKVRLHIWHPGFKKQDVSEIHDHPWHFTSEIVWGEITNHLFVLPSEDLAGECELFNKGRILCGPNPVTPGAVPCGQVRLRRVRGITYRSGDHYAMRSYEIHRSDPAPGTVTICSRTPLEDPDHANVFWEVGKEWVSAEPRAATRDEVQAITEFALGVAGL